jgi:DNA polymerase-3 subunit delta'
LIKSGRLAHAYLLAGPKGIGKSETAFEVAKLVNCEKRIAGEASDACGQCSSCIKMNSGNHPDVYRIDCGDTDSIKIEQIRELISRLQMRAFEASVKVCIIKDIEVMTAQSSNAFLKTLEEPSNGTLMILTTSVPEENLATIVSRCHVMKFYPSSVPAVRERLMKDDGLDAPSAQFLAQFSQGCIGKARELNEDGFMKQKNDVINNLVFSQGSDVYLKKILADKPQTQTALSVLLSWFRDLLILKSGGKQDQIVHLDRYDELLTLEKKYTFAKIDGIIDELVRALALLGENLNIKIPFILLREKIWVK